jgi:hypothetical protein
MEDDLKWPIDSVLIRKSNLVKPNNGDNKRVCLEQDYGSDREVVNSARSKLKRELKNAIDELNYK